MVSEPEVSLGRAGDLSAEDDLEAHGARLNCSLHKDKASSTP